MLGPPYAVPGVSEFCQSARMKSRPVPRDEIAATAADEQIAALATDQLIRTVSADQRIVTVETVHVAAARRRDGVVHASEACGRIAGRRGAGRRIGPASARDRRTSRRQCQPQIAVGPVAKRDVQRLVRVPENERRVILPEDRELPVGSTASVRGRSADRRQPTPEPNRNSPSPSLLFDEVFALAEAQSIDVVTGAAVQVIEPACSTVEDVVTEATQ